MLEYARHELGIVGADHQESAPDAQVPLINKLQCSLVGVMDTIHIFEETTTFRLYGRDRANEHFSCSFGLNETFRDHLEAGPLTVAAVDANRNVRIIELSDHSFFVATLFLPQFSSKPGAPHPLILEFVKASAERANGQ